MTRWPALDYHEATKYSEESVRQGDGLDWANQPPQTKEIVSTQRLSLRPYVNLPVPGATDAPIAPIEGVGLPELSRLLYFGNGVTGMKRPASVVLTLWLSTMVIWGCLSLPKASRTRSRKRSLIRIHVPSSFHF